MKFLVVDERIPLPYLVKDVAVQQIHMSQLPVFKDAIVLAADSGFVTVGDDIKCRSVALVTNEDLSLDANDLAHYLPSFFLS